MKRMILAAFVLTVGCSAILGAARSAGISEQVQSLRAFYFGNSLTGCTNPRWHQEMGKSAGKEWVTDGMYGAGWPLWMHRRELKTGESSLSTAPRGDLTIDPELVQSASYKAKQFYKGCPWDAIVLQPFFFSLHRTVTEIWGTSFEEPTDVGAIAAAGDIIELYLKTNPQGRVYIYADWPSMKGGQIPAKGERPEWAQKEGVRIARAEFPKRDEFDYEQEWLGKKFSHDDPDRPWLNNWRCQDWHYQLFEALKKKFPELWREARLRMIPTGDVFMALERRMRAGRVPGIDSIADFYTDVQHIRAGLPRYTAAACFYAVMFGEHPGALDWRIYNDKARYGDDPHHDKYPFVEITPERARIVNDTIWQVVVDHPYTRLEGGATE